MSLAVTISVVIISFALDVYKSELSFESCYFLFDVWQRRAVFEYVGSAIAWRYAS